jgi:hypothetical protein
MWLDADFEGGRGRSLRGSSLNAAVREAKKMLEGAPEGQVGIFTAYVIGDFLGYVIKQPGEVPYFEPAPKEGTP